MSYTLYLPLTFLYPPSHSHQCSSFLLFHSFQSFSFLIPHRPSIHPLLCINSTFPLLTFNAVDVSAFFCICLFLFFSHTFPICPLSIFFILFSPGSSTFLFCFSPWFLSRYLSQSQILYFLIFFVSVSQLLPVAFKPFYFLSFYFQFTLKPCNVLR